MKGNERDCICEKPKGKHRKHCDAYRLAQFLIKMACLNRLKDKKHMKKTITTLAILAIATGAYGATTYRSIGITPEAKLKVVALSKELKMTQRDTASKMIMEWGQPKNNIVHALSMIFQYDQSGTEQKMINVCRLLES